LKKLILVLHFKYKLSVYPRIGKVWSGDCARKTSKDDFPKFLSFNYKDFNEKTIQCGSSLCNRPGNFTILEKTILCFNGFYRMSTITTPSMMSSRTSSSSSNFAKINFVLHMLFYLICSTYCNKLFF
jgi:hypothetical protein